MKKIHRRRHREMVRRDAETGNRSAEFCPAVLRLQYGKLSVRIAMGLFSGIKGESIFCEPLLRYFRHNPLPALFNKTAGLKDDRLLALVTALIVEDRLDAALGAFLPRYPRLTSTAEFRFSMKIALAEALGQIPPRILSAASVIRKIRNEFAHQLEIESLTGLKSSLTADLKNLRADVYGVLGADQRKPLPTLLEEYKALAFFCIAGLDAYRENLDYLRSHIETPEFMDALLKKCAADNEAEMRSVLAQKPISVEVIDGHTIETYAKGLVCIGGGDGGGPLDLGKILNRPVK
jgi:hypothetical protein